MVSIDRLVDASRPAAGWSISPAGESALAGGANFPGLACVVTFAAVVAMALGINAGVAAQRVGVPTARKSALAGGAHLTG